jgi:hypothetical protein
VALSCGFLSRPAHKKTPPAGAEKKRGSCIKNDDGLLKRLR